MAFENLIQLSFTAEELKKIDDSLAEIDKVLKGKTHNLTSEERKQYGSIAEQNKLFVNKAKLYMEQYPDYVPRYIDKAEFDKDYTAREVLESRMIRLKGIVEQVEDTKKLLDFDNYQAALSFYKSIKVLSEENLPGTTNIAQDLKQFFPRSTKAKTENTNNTPEKPSV